MKIQPNSKLHNTPPFVGGIEPVANKNPPNGSQRKDSVRELPTMALKVTPKC